MTEWKQKNWSWEATGEELEKIDTRTFEIELDDNFLLKEIRKKVEDIEQDSDYTILQNIFHIKQNIFEVTIDLVNVK